jgi:regulator of nucleoside diphosphate kinase
MMHDKHQPTIVSPSDYARLQGLMATLIGSRTPLASLLRHKLGSAVVISESDLDADVVTIGARVRFTINGGAPEIRRLGWRQDRSKDGLALSTLSPRGLALLGLRTGQWISYQTDNRQTEVLSVQEVDSPNALAEAGPDAKARAIARWEDDGGRVLDLEQAGAVSATFGRTRVSQAAGWSSA